MGIAPYSSQKEDRRRENFPRNVLGARRLSKSARRIGLGIDMGS